MEPGGTNWTFLIGTIALGAVSAWWVFRDARARDHNPVIWAIACVFSALTVGVLATLAVVVMYFVLRPRGELLTCPHCSKKYIHNLAFCPNCGKPVKEECLKCHDLMEVEAEVCPHCGMRSA